MIQSNERVMFGCRTGFSSENGTAITYAEIPAGSSMSEITVPVVNSVSGNKDVYFVFSDNISFDSWSFK